MNVAPCCKVIFLSNGRHMSFSHRCIQQDCKYKPYVTLNACPTVVMEDILAATPVLTSQLTPPVDLESCW